ncbi:TATA-binding protein-associated factor 172 [Naegleria gruberi]|uniref:TATA-binding protein-associated factor 172 n=1 Tax=Naegleria gruberi TaxID=5762 RepID=D2V3G4_NAEGR|nr:TATA-binding protein-associated factor 172 [Naegleria gruberi]EFC48766.1 TATA-binding protein-associated factor 172 [Naegleria gruberi]|eukprot:XP_002681510.1 TATA-binding protein-associated factor 172 [Naegleria gruberi strain NEG-M]
MTSRLDRLLNLLDSGSPAVRSAAAKQIAEATKFHQAEIPSVLSKISVLLGSSSWETRSAAGEAINAIAQNVPLYRPEQANIKKEELTQEQQVRNYEKLQEDYQTQQEKFRFANFNIRHVVKNGIPLYGSNLAVPDEEQQIKHLKPKDKLAFHKRQIYGRLGYLSFEEKQSLLLCATEKEPVNNHEAEEVNSQPLSAKERREKFMQKQNKKQNNQSIDEQIEEDQRQAKKMKTVITEQPQSENKIVIESAVDTSDMFEHERWPFQILTERLLVDLFNSSWTIRHGAAIAIREILKVPEQLQSAGKSIFTQNLQYANELWLEDCCVRVLCLFALDKFTDYLSDLPISPITETGAQILGLIFKYLNSETVRHVITNLVILMGHDQEWKVRHNALLGLKYAVALRTEAIDELFGMVLPAIIMCLSDEAGSTSADDVKAVAADCLVPIAEHVMRMDRNYVNGIFSILWDSLIDMDDLSSSTASIMTLLAKLYSIPMYELVLADRLHLLVPRLYPYLRHNIITVRMSALETLQELIQRTEITANSWILKENVLKHIIALIFQNLILDPKENIVEKSLIVWEAFIRRIPEDYLTPIMARYIGAWASLMSTPVGNNFDLSLMTLPEEVYNSISNRWGATDSLKRKYDGSKSLDNAEKQTFSMRLQVSDMEELTLMRIATSKAIALFTISITQPQNLNELFTTFDLLLRSAFALHKETAGILLQNIFQTCGERNVTFNLPETGLNLLSQIVDTVNLSNMVEIQHYFTPLVTECNYLLQFYSKLGWDVSSFYSYNQEGLPSLNMSTAVAQDLIGKYREYYAQHLVEHPTLLQELETLAGRVKTALDTYFTNWLLIQNRALSILSSALIFQGGVPQKSVLSKMMVQLLSTVESQASSLTLQKLACKSIAKMLIVCKDLIPPPNSAIVKKLLDLLSKTMPKITVHKALEKENAQPNEEDEINELKDAASQVDSTKDDPSQIAQRGASISLNEIATIFKERLFIDLEPLRMHTLDVIFQQVDFSLLNKTNPQPPEKTIVNALHILRSIVPSINSQLYETLSHVLGSIIANYVPHQDIEIRKHAALTISEICYYMEEPALIIIVKQLVPLLANPTNVYSRRGSSLAIFSLISRLEMKCLPAVAFFAVPLLKRMSDQDDVTREISSNCFGSVIKLLPLEKSAIPLKGLEKQLAEEHEFIDQLLDNSKVVPFDIPIKINAELRQYQKDGVSWLAFLNKYNLHGILCDDMGLGKTLQTICMVYSDIHMRKIQFQQTGNQEFVHLPSLVVCPPILLGHWADEISKFCPDLKSLQYYGSVAQRKLWRSEFHNQDIVILSYDLLRNDIKDIVACQSNWNYCILDEGHIIKNKKTQITKAVKQIKANHRLLLSGTPIQNNVLELWSLFDFLMPGFLGTEKEFNAKYSKPIQSSRDAKANSKEQASGTIALQNLHRQVLPFLLRRVKEDVLHDLPEKIIQDYYCDLSPIQSKLYEFFAKKEISKVSQELKSQQEDKTKAKEISENSHVFKALKYLRKLCNHPCLVLEPDHPMYESVTQEIKQQGLDVRDVNLSPKLLSLKQLLNDCGIGAGNSDVDSSNQHRVLIFCQLKQMLDIIQNELFAKYMPNVTFMRLDGDVETTKRYEIVTKFNSDPTIDVLLLTTKIGGLGLNLTGADTVIFVEHDWNPSADLQAMDRAHRIGQKKVVNVYRLITRNTLEEKIMGLQKFKTNISKSVINKENSSLSSMDTDQLVDLFNFSGSNGTDSSSAAQLEKPKKSGLGQLMETMEDYDQDKQYQDFNLNSFMNNQSKHK